MPSDVRFMIKNMDLIGLDKKGESVGGEIRMKKAL
jgi:hypothetical protein